jgi:hypothetical protein
LEEFLVNSIFNQKKIPTMDMKVLVYSNFREKKESPWRMEDFALPSAGARFKKWKCRTPILPKCPTHPQTSS